MAEIVGAVASAITLCGVLAQVVKHASELHNTPTDVLLLKKQIDCFQGTLKTLETTTTTSTSPGCHSALARASLIMVQLHEVLPTRIFIGGATSKRIRRREWFRNKHKISNLIEDLKDARQSILEHLTAESIVSMHRIETSLRAAPKDTALDHLSVSEHKDSNAPSMTSLRLFGRDNQVLESRTSHTRTSSFKSPLNEEDNLDTEYPFPTTVLESSVRFRPSAYTVDRGFETCFTYWTFEVCATDHFRQLHCALLYLNTSSNWLRLYLTVELTIDSKYWFIRSSKQPNPKVAHPLPMSLRLLLKNYLATREIVRQDIHLELYLGRQERLRLIGPSETTLPKIYEATADLKAFTMSFRHVHCPRYYDRSLEHQPLQRFRPRKLFLTRIDSRWVEESRFGATREQIEADLYQLIVLSTVTKNTPGISPFLGIILDDETNLINGFLFGLPEKGRLRNIISVSISRGQPVLWTRCMKWCRQIVQGVAEVHSKGFVLGFLADIPHCVEVDAHDNAVLASRFSKKSYVNEDRMEEWPPECRGQPSPILATRETDLYQLGLLIWRIAATMNSRSVRIDDGTQAGSDSQPTPSVFKLPVPGGFIPKQLQKVVAACRKDTPDNRTPAWELLKFFEDNCGLMCDGKHEDGCNASAYFHQNCIVSNGCISPTSVTLEHCQEMFGIYTTCNSCFARTTHYFHCTVCANGDYDICDRCFLGDGVHCLDQTHALMEYLVDTSSGYVEGKYYTSISDKTGQREIF